MNETIPPVPEEIRKRILVKGFEYGSLGPADLNAHLRQDSFIDGAFYEYSLHEAELESLRKERRGYKNALEEISERVLQYHKAEGNSPAANHCRNIALEALVIFDPTETDKPPTP